MAWGYGQPVPKPQRGMARVARKLRRQRDEKKFRDLVWDRCRDAFGDAYCEACGMGPLFRTTNVLHPRAGHVAHHRGRRVAPADRCNPDAASLLCRNCHLLDHGMRF
jgi:hypothetical protein